MKTYNQFLNTPFSEEVKPEPPEAPKESPQIKSKEKRQMQIKKQVLLKKMQAVRAGAGADIVASHTPDGELVEGDVHSGQGEKIQKRTKKWMDKKGMKGAPGLDAMKARTAEHKAKRGVKEGTDKAFEYVKKQIAAKYGKDSYVSKDNPMKPPTAAQKKAAAAHRAKLAKQDHRDPTEKASDGRYSDRHSNRGSD